MILYLGVNISRPCYGSEYQSEASVLVSCCLRSALCDIHFYFVYIVGSETVSTHTLGKRSFVDYIFSALYVHKLHTLWWHDLNKPEQFGFLSW